MNAENVFSDLPALETDRLLLRRLILADAADVFAYARDPEVARYTTWEAHRSLDESLGFLKRVLDHYAAGEVAPWGVVHNADHRVIGTCGFASWRREHARAELGYALARTYWNQGFATEAVRAVIDFGFRRMALNRVEARCEIPNVASARVMEKAGMTFEGILRKHMYAKGAYRDLKLYAILREGWLRHVAPGLTYARAEEGDVEGIRQVAEAAWQATYCDIFAPEFIAEFLARNYSSEALARSVRNPRSVFLVARDAGRVVGFGHFGDGGRGPELFRMYVLPGYWRAGIGTRLTALMEQHWRDRGVGEYFCFVHRRNEVGKAFYLKQGFAHDAAHDHEDEWCMVKRLLSQGR